MQRTKLFKSITTPVIITNIILLFMQVFTNIETNRCFRDVESYFSKY